MVLFSRDSVIWWIGLVGGVVTALIAGSDVLEIPHAVNLWLMRVGVVVAAVSGWMKTSPLPSEQAAAVGKAAAKIADGKRELAKASADSVSSDEG
jgi:hypothetical protein